MRKLEIFLPKSTYIAGELVQGYVRLVCDDDFECNRIHITIMGKEQVVITRGSGDDRRTYREHRDLIADRILLHEGGHVYYGTQQYDFKFRLPDNLPSFYYGRSGTIQYWLEAQVEISWALDVKAKKSINILAPLREGHIEGGRSMYEDEGVRMLELESKQGMVCIGDTLSFSFRIHRDANIRGVRFELQQREIARARRYKDDTRRTHVEDYFEEYNVRRDDWITVNLKTNNSIPASFQTDLITSHLILKVTIDIPWRFDKSVEVPIVSGYCVDVPPEDDLFGDF